MAKATGGKRANSDGSAEVGRTIDRLDREIVRLIQERAKVVQKAGAARRGEGSSSSVVEPIADGSAVWLQHGRGALGESSLRAIHREISSACRALVRPIRVAYLGPPYSYSHQAAVERFGSSAELAPVATIAAVFEELSLGHAQYGLVPIENSTDGRVIDTLDMFARLPARICGEVQLRIHHCLLARCARGEIQDVYSKPQAISQCRDWISKHLQGVRVVEMTSTAAAAQLAADKPGSAAIAGYQAAVNYGLDVLAANIEDNKNNVTRFAVIGGETPRRTGRDKTALMFELAHRPGSLAEAMVVFKRGRLNLTWIESFPMPGTKSEYLFFVEFEGHESDAKVRRSLEALRRRTVRLEVLGSYPRGDLAE